MVHLRHVLQATLAVLVLAAAPLALRAQNSTAIARGEAAADQPLPTLERPAVLTLRDVALADALVRLYEASGVPISFSPSMVPGERTVSCACGELSVAGALDRMLEGTGLRYRAIEGHVIVYRVLQSELRRTLQPPEAHYASLAPLPVVRMIEPQNRRQEPGTIIGRVTAAETDEGLPSVQVSVDGAGRTLTGDDGRYRIGRVEPGSHTVSVSSIGYRKATREVEVGDGATVVVDFALDISPTTLDELVVTQTGEQRRVELGHVVGRINADSLVKAAPISTLSELLTGRVPGLQVFTQSGQVGGKVQLKARTANSIFLGDDGPILIVDGVRYANDHTGQTGAFGSEETSRLNDLNPNDIESIEVVKGPAAATLYGTDAANGVIVITTKRGRPGPARWSAYARATQNEMPRHRYPDMWWGWRTLRGVPSLTSSCTLRLVARGTCGQDSITAMPHPLNDPELTMFQSKPGWQYGMNVAGGSQELRYYFSADLDQVTGPIQMPVARIEELTAARGIEGLPDEQLEPNVQRRLTMRGNMTLALGSTAELQFNSGYGHTRARTGQSSYAGLFGNPTPGNPYGRFNDIADLFSRTSTEGTDRVFGSIGGQWRPVTWLHGRGTFGVDLANSERYSLLRPEHDPAIFGSPGQVQEDRTRRLGVTGDVGLSAHARLGRLGFRTAVGAQLTRQKRNILTSGGSGLPPGGASVAQTENKYASQFYTETATLGSYVEETIGLNDRLFVTGALRADGASNFGRDYKAAIYPKVSASWLVSEEPFVPRVPGLDELRVRYAFGASGQQPLSYMVRPGYAIRQAQIDGATTTAIEAQQIGNVDLRPERVREQEFGLDAAGLAGRVQLGLTWFDRMTTDQIVNRPASLGFGTVYRNVGRLSAHGFEAELTVRPVETRQVSWMVTLQHAFGTTTVEDLGGLTPVKRSGSSWVEGYPLGARFATEILGWDDADGNGILEPSEIQMSEEPVYQGEGLPPRTQTLVTSLGLFQQRVRLSALLQRQSGHTQINGRGCGGRCRAAVDPSTPLEAQALVLASQWFRDYADIEPADHTRLQEVTVAFDLPETLLRAVRLRTGTVSLSGRNLGLWTSFSGPDPAGADIGQYFGGSNASNIPESRTWVVRFDIGS